MHILRAFLFPVDTDIYSVYSLITLKKVFSDLSSLQFSIILKYVN